tara:strand:+ start:264 stop:578 length:315 start_codon:yes stop_codon:yes gene_type:complete
MAGNLVDLNNDNFDEVTASGTVLVDFWAPWCGPCKQLTPILEKVKVDVGESVIISKVNVDENPQLASKFGVRSIPTILIFKNGEIKETLIGLKQQAELTSLLLD